PASARTSPSPATRLRSMTTAGRTSRMFIIGTRLWPPASSLAFAAMPGEEIQRLPGRPRSEVLERGGTHAGRLHLPQLRVIEHRQVHPPRRHPGADLLDERGHDAHLVFRGGPAEPGLARDTVSVDLERGGVAALDGQP